MHAGDRVQPRLFKDHSGSKCAAVVSGYHIDVIIMLLIQINNYFVRIMVLVADNNSLNL